MEHITANKSSFIMEGSNITTWIRTLVNALNQETNFIDFSIKTSFKSEDFELLLGVSKSEFLLLFEICRPHLHKSKNRCPENALALLLMKLRMDVSQKVLAFLFGIKSQESVSHTISHVAEILNTHYVPYHLGFQHLSREEAKAHDSNFFHSILQTPPETLHLTMDATYLYIQKSSNHELQRKTYSMHKHRNLLKPMLTTLADGYILSSTGLWYTDGANND
jgi:hypothetical protein